MKAYVLIAKGFEEIEAITTVDVLRRAGMEVLTLSIGESRQVKGSHNIEIITDDLLENYIDKYPDIIITPGGMPASEYLRSSNLVRTLLRNQFNKGKYIASICASPIVLDAVDILDDISYTCYPGFEQQIKGRKRLNQRVVVSHKIITAQGPGVSMDFALKIVEELISKDISEQLKKDLVV